MKIKLKKILTVALFLSLALFLAQSSYATEVLGTLSSGTNPTQTTMNGEVIKPQNNLAGLINGNTANSAISNLLGTGNNSAVMLEGMLIGALLTFFVGLFIFMIIIFIKKGRRKNINTI